MRVKTWKVIDYGNVKKDGPRIPLCCQCGYEAEIPIKGRALAALGGRGGPEGVVFDNDEIGALPAKVQCRKCRRIFTQEPANVR